MRPIANPEVPVIDLATGDDVHSILPPCPAVGEGVHHAILGAVSELALLGYSPDEIEPMVIEWMSPVITPYPREIPDALEKVFGSGNPRLRNESFTKSAKWPASNFSDAIQITRNHGRFEQAELMLKLAEASPVDTMDKDLQLTTEEWLSVFYADADLLCIGENFWDREVRSFSGWKKSLRYAHYISPNPFRSAFWGRKNDNVLERRFLITEMDINDAQRLVVESYRLDPFDVQAAVILHLQGLGQLPLLSVVWSGKKSLHALWRADRDDAVNLSFMSAAVSIGVDKAGYTSSQFGRIYNPQENQPLFYLDPRLMNLTSNYDLSENKPA